MSIDQVVVLLFGEAVGIFVALLVALVVSVLSVVRLGWDLDSASITLPVIMFCYFFAWIVVGFIVWSWFIMGYSTVSAAIMAWEAWQGWKNRRDKRKAPGVFGKIVIDLGHRLGLTDG